MSTSREYLVIGHPRCGSGFAADCLTKLGISCSHEIEPVKSRALSSWAFTIKHQNDDGISPRYGIGGWDWRSRYSFDNIIAHLRNPFDAFPSIINENSHDWSLNIRSKYIQKYLSKTISGNHLEQAILSYVYWNQIAISKSEFYFRIESEDDFQSLIVFLQSKNESLNSIEFKSLRKINSKPNEKHKINLKDYESVSTETLDKLYNFCNQYGYKYIL